MASIRREIATLVAEKCVDPATQTPYSVGIIEKAMAEAGYSVRANKNAKSQVSECIKALQTDSTLPIERAKMRIRVSVPAANIDELRERLLDGVDKLEHEEKTGEDWLGTMLIDPGQFRVISELLNKTVKGKGRVETLTFNTSATAGS